MDTSHKRPIRSAVLAITCLAAACSQEEYTFVATLGDDTTSIEHVTRKRNTILSDVVEQSPRVMRKHWEATLNPDGSLRRWSMDKRILNPRAEETAVVQFTADFGADSVLVSQRSGDETRTFVMHDLGQVTVPWESYVYGLYELLFAAALEQAGDTVPIKQYLPGAGLTRGVIRKAGGDSLTFTTGGLAGTGIAHMDARGRMLSYSGRHTTFKHEVARVSDKPDIDAIAQRFAAREQAAPARSLSPRDTTRAAVGQAELLIDYSRPLRRGRDILGNVVPYGAVWRTGANAASQLSTTAAVFIAGIEVPPGTYTLWTLPTRDGAQLIINRQNGQWGTRYNIRMDLARAALQTERLAAPVDTFTIRIEPDGAPRSTLVIEWDHFRWTAPIVAKN